MLRYTRAISRCATAALYLFCISCASMAGQISGIDGSVQADDLHVLAPVSIAQSQSPTMCLAVAGGVETPGAAVVLSACDQSVAQQFFYQGGRLHVLTSSCLTQVPQTSVSAASFAIAPCDVGDTLQRFILTHATAIIAQDNTCLGTTADAALPGTAATNAACSAQHASQAWTLVPVTSTGVISPTDIGASGTASAPTNPATAAGAATCPALGTWDAQAAQFEAQVLLLVNAQRAEGSTCPDGPTFAPAAALSADARLTCETRAYAKAMQAGGFFSHIGQDNTSPFDRMTAAGVHWTAAAENIAEGQATPEAVVAAWMSDAGHCQDLMGAYAITGIGYYQGVWVQDFAKE